MSLLTDIQAAAVDPACTTSNLLRRCQILAARLRHEPFKQWVAHELNGYPNEAPLPPYRGPFQAALKADTSGPFGTGVRNVGVPDARIPADIVDDVRAMRFYQGVGGLEALLADAQRAGQPFVIVEFETDFAVAIRVVVDHQTVRLWKELPVSYVAGVLDSVKSKALEFPLDIEVANPDAGEAAPGGEPPVPAGRIDFIFNTTIFGGQNAIGPNASVNVVQGDIESLMGYLESLGIEPADRDELRGALDEDKGLGARVGGWLAALPGKVASFGDGVAQNAAGGLIVAAILKYLGVG